MIPRHEEDTDSSPPFGFWSWLALAVVLGSAVAGLVLVVTGRLP